MGDSPDPRPPPDPALEQAFRSVRTGAARQCGAMTVYPLHLPGDTGPDYVTLDEARAAGAFRSTSVSDVGAAPTLEVINVLRRAVLLIDGETLDDADQHRIVNLSLLIPAGFHGTIPVSCTRHGRCRPPTANWAATRTAIDRKSRRPPKPAAASKSSQDTAESSPGESQADLWNFISQSQSRAENPGATGSPREAFVAKAKELSMALSVFSLEGGQHGLMVFLNGTFAGLELLSRADAYAQLHHRLVRSYALESILATQRQRDGRPGPSAADANDVLRRVGNCAARGHPAAGLGETLWCEERDVTGMALVADGVVVHAAFFTP